MQRPLLLIVMLCAALAAAACDDPYQQNDLELLSSYRSYGMCTCLFTTQMDEAFCANFSTALALPFETYTIDVEHRVVEAQLGLMWSDRAHAHDEPFGCWFE